MEAGFEGLAAIFSPRSHEGKGGNPYQGGFFLWTYNMHAKDGYAVTQHRFAKPGHYLVRVERTNERIDSHGWKRESQSAMSQTPTLAEKWWQKNDS